MVLVPTNFPAQTRWLNIEEYMIIAHSANYLIIPPYIHPTPFTFTPPPFRIFFSSWSSLLSLPPPCLTPPLTPHHLLFNPILFTPSVASPPAPHVAPVPASYNPSALCSTISSLSVAHSSLSL